MNTITIIFKPCRPTPSKGYVVSYRPVGSEEPYRVWPVNFLSSPAIIETDEDPDGTSYEGYIQGDCGGGMLGIRVPFTAINTGCDGGGSSGGGSGSGGSGGSTGGSAEGNIMVMVCAAESSITSVQYDAENVVLDTGSFPIFSGLSGTATIPSGIYTFTVNATGAGIGSIRVTDSMGNIICLPYTGAGAYVFEGVVITDAPWSIVADCGACE